MGAFSNMDYELQNSEAAVSDAFTEDDATMPVSRRLNRWVSYHPPKNEKGRTDFLQVCTSFAICCHAAAILFFTDQVTHMFERIAFLPNEAEFSGQGAPRYGVIHVG